MTVSSRPSPRILVFDSGLGGLSVVHEISISNIDYEIYYCADTAYFPYGEKSDQMLTERVPLIIAMVAEKCAADLIVIACNTASTLALERVRAVVKVPVVGVVPAIRPAAALTKSGVIGLLGTPNTIGHPYTDKLIEDFAQGVVVVRHGAIGLAATAEDMLSGGSIDQGIISASINGLFGQSGGDRMDVVVLACTHYPHLRAHLAALAPHPVTWIDSGAAIARRVGSLLNGPHGGYAQLRRAFTTGGHDSATSFGLSKWGFETVIPLSTLRAPD